MTRNVCGACCSAYSGVTNSSPTRLIAYRHIVITTSAPSARNEPEPLATPAHLQFRPLIQGSKREPHNRSNNEQSSSIGEKAQATQGVSAGKHSVRSQCCFAIPVPLNLRSFHYYHWLCIRLSIANQMTIRID